MRPPTHSLRLTLLALALSTPSWAGDVTMTLDAGDGFVVEDSTGAIQRLRVEEATGNVSRNGALFVHTTGTNNTFLGEGAGNTATYFLGRNAAFGTNALASITSGYANSAFGRDALAATTDGDQNSAFGASTLVSQTTGRLNSAFGAYAMHSNTSGDFNSAFGVRALLSNTTGRGNSALGLDALTLNTTGDDNSAFGRSALALNTTGERNSAFGVLALTRNATASDNSAFGYDALGRNETGQGNAAFGAGALDANQTGSRNSAFGRGALGGNTTASDNSAFGYEALGALTTGYNNAAFGRSALSGNFTGIGNSAFGRLALRDSRGNGNTALGASSLLVVGNGDDNTAVGRSSGQNLLTGSDNVILGEDAAFNLSNGSDNVILGEGAGVTLSSGSNNIYIKNTGVASESGQIRIGNTTDHTAAAMAGIFGNTASGGLGVVVNASGTLGTTASSARFKRGIEDMGEASEMLMELRPVTFHYREDAGGDGRTRAYGLIAEEVAEVAPGLVALDAEGRPYSVRYHLLPPMLLNEMQKQKRTMDAQRHQLVREAERRGELEALIEDQRAAIAVLMARLGRLEADVARANR